jgi:hypothetical protein
LFFSIPSTITRNLLCLGLENAGLSGDVKTNHVTKYPIAKKTQSMVSVNVIWKYKW